MAAFSLGAALSNTHVSDVIAFLLVKVGLPLMTPITLMTHLQSPN